MPLADPLKAQVHLDLHRLAPQVVAAQIVDVFANARTGQMRARRAGVDVGTAPTRRRGRRSPRPAGRPGMTIDPWMTALFASVFRGGKRRVWPVRREAALASYAYSSLYLIEQP
jgi:hypothetical protein